ncbi:MOSC domain-containing protein [Microlunatus aurantiacus]|uniref:MOSC domain-containing protein n=1 Tax=Microlunatus aurantiacus TaxID=446786 RepID=A0ABP7DH02_9ACTN
MTVTDTGGLRLTGLRRYPVKSCRGEDLDVATVEPWGLTGDRRWMVVDPSGEAVTAREANRLVLITPSITDSGLLLSAPDIEDLDVDRPASGPLVEVKIWDDRLLARAADPVAGDWFSGVIGRSLRLVYLDDPRRRPVNPAYGAADDTVSLADAYPLLLATEESLTQLNTWIAEGPRSADGPLPMTRFRPNLIVRGEDAFAEDTWRRVRVGEVVFRVVKLCDRCVLTTIDPVTATRTKEPLVSLARHRRWDGKTWFAVNLVPEAPYGSGVPEAPYGAGVPEALYGSVRVGDQVEVLETR